jgi:hypothetical protein
LEELLRDGFDTLRAEARRLLGAPDPGAALITWLRQLATATARYDGLPGSVMGALNDPGSRLHAACAELRSAAAELLGQAQRAGRIRPDLETDELFATVSAMAWVADQAPGSADPTERYLRLLLEGLVV